MMSIDSLRHDEGGFVLITTMMTMVILTLIGISAVSTSIVELQIAGNELLSKEAFYRADGGIQAGFEIIEQNLGCPNGFSGSTSPDPLQIAGIDIYDAVLAYHETISDTPNGPTDVNAIPSDIFRSIRIPVDPTNRVDTQPHSNIVAYGNTEYLPGSGLQMAAGYEGKGKGSAGSGAVIKYELYSQHIGNSHSEAKIVANWYHTIGQEGVCNY